MHLSSSSSSWSTCSFVLLVALHRRRRRWLVGRLYACICECRRQRSATPRRDATARTTSFILSSLPAMPRVAREPVAVAVCSSCGATEKDGALERWKKRCSGKQATKERERERRRRVRRKENAASLEFCTALRVSMAGNMGIIGGMLFETVARLVLFLLSLLLLSISTCIPSHLLLHHGARLF